jgi:hypothetical protein
MPWAATTPNVTAGPGRYRNHERNAAPTAWRLTTARVASHSTGALRRFGRRVGAEVCVEHVLVDASPGANGDAIRASPLPDERWVDRT